MPRLLGVSGKRKGKDMRKTKAAIILELRSKFCEARDIWEDQKKRAGSLEDQLSAYRTEVANLQDRLKASEDATRKSRMETWTLQQKLSATEAQHKAVVEDFFQPLMQEFGLDPSTPYTKAARIVTGRLVHAVERRLYDKQGECLQAVLDAMKLMAGRKV